MRALLCRLGLHDWHLVMYHFPHPPEGGWFERECRRCGKRSSTDQFFIRPRHRK